MTTQEVHAAGPAADLTGDRIEVLIARLEALRTDIGTEIDLLSSTRAPHPHDPRSPARAATSRSATTAHTHPTDSVAVVEELAAAGLADAQEIGRGGFGVVYRATQTMLDRVVAVKVLSTEIDESRERFLREELAMGRLSGHPNIVDILQVDTTATGRQFIVMPYAARGSLEQRLHTDGPMTWSDTLRVGVKLAGAIETAHRAQVLHRDVKPGNVLLSRYGEPQLTDFGIAHISGGFRTSRGLVTGSPAFTAPEVLKGEEPTVLSDVYSLGSTLFALLTGHAAFERGAGEKVVAQFLRISRQPIPDLRAFDIPATVAAAIETAMATDPRERPESAAVFGDLLRAIQTAHGQIPDEMVLPVEDPAADPQALERYSAPTEPMAPAPEPTAAHTPAFDDDLPVPIPCTTDTLAAVCVPATSVPEKDEPR